MHKSVRFEIYGFKNPAIWLVECIYSILLQTWSKNVLTVTWKPDFLQACSFCRIMKMTITHYVKLKKINTLDFWLFWPMWGKFLDFSSKIFFFFFLKNPTMRVFYPEDILTSRAISEKHYEPFWRKYDYWMTYWTTDWHWWFPRNSFCLKVGIKKLT